MGDIKTIMQTNIDKILQRGERLELVIDKTSDLAETATVSSRMIILCVDVSVGRTSFEKQNNASAMETVWHYRSNLHTRRHNRPYPLPYDQKTNMTLSLS